ncbi:MAG: nitroreductase family protein [Pseudomonadales bacterium]|nr:nitroreductase family protein [Pseudomonadales bacterium]
MNVSDIDVRSVRTTTTSELHPLFLERWSPRAFAPRPISEEAVDALLEAARWAPSCFNAQPWRFIYAHRDTAEFARLLGLLAETNRVWAQHSSLLMVVISRNQFEHNDSPALTNSFDAGAAWMSLALQARHMGLAAHGMRGFDIDTTRVQLSIPALYDIEAMVAVGHPGDIATLPESYQARETPSGRRPLAEIAMTGTFSEPTT